MAAGASIRRVGESAAKAATARVCGGGAGSAEREMVPCGATSRPDKGARRGRASRRRLSVASRKEKRITFPSGGFAPRAGRTHFPSSSFTYSSNTHMYTCGGAGGCDRRDGLRHGNWWGGGGMAGGKVQAWGARGTRGGRRALSSKSAQADALTPIFVAIAEPQLPEPMSATFSGIVAGRGVRERRLWMQGVVGGNRFCGSGSPSLSTTAPSSGSPQVLSPPQHSAVLDCVYRPHRGRSSWKCVRRPLATRDTAISYSTSYEPLFIVETPLPNTAITRLANTREYDPAPEYDPIQQAN